MNRLFNALRRELYAFHPGLYLASGLLAFFPIYSGNSLRSFVLRLLGFQIGAHTHFFGMPRILGPRHFENRLVIGPNCLVSYGCTFDLSGRITVDERANIGPECMLLTGSHEVGSQDNRLGSQISKDIDIGRGVWLGARCTILPGVTIGQGAVVGAGSLINRDLPANTICAGVPARVIRELDAERVMANEQF